MKILGWLLAVLILISIVSALESPCFKEVVIKGNGSARVYDLNWTPSLESDVEYSLYFNMSSEPMYVGNQSHYFVDIYEGANIFGISAKVFNESRVCEGVIQYNRNKPPTAPSINCPEEADLESSELLCNISYDSTDPDDVELLYVYFIDGDLKEADVDSQTLSVEGVSSGVHNLSICAFDGEFFACAYASVNFIMISKPVFSSVYIENPAVPFYGDLVRVYARINVTINDTRACSVTGIIKKGGDSYGVACLYSGGIHICLANLTYKMEPGKYNVLLTADNGVKTETYVKNNGLEVYEVLSVVLESPEYDLTQVFDEWVFSQKPLRILNYGSIDLKRIYIDSAPLECIGATFSNITVGTRSSQKDSYNVMSGAYFDIDVDPAEKKDFNVFIHNPSRLNPKNCGSVWNLEVYSGG